MTKYNWNERHIITFPEEKLALATKTFMFTMVKEAIKGIDMQFEKNKITALIGPSGCGKSTFLRSLNRMNDTIDIAKVTGQILYEGIDVNAKTLMFTKCVSTSEWFSNGQIHLLNQFIKILHLLMSVQVSKINNF